MIPAPIPASCLSPKFGMRSLIAIVLRLSGQFLLLLLLGLGPSRNVFLPFYLTTGSGEDVLHGLALIFGQLLVEISIRDHASLEGRDGCRSIAFRNGDLLMVETRNVGANWLGSMLEDFVEVIELFSRLLLLANCSTNFSLRAAKDRMDPVGRLMYH